MSIRSNARPLQRAVAPSGSASVDGSNITSGSARHGRHPGPPPTPWLSRALARALAALRLLGKTAVRAFLALAAALESWLARWGLWSTSSAAGERVRQMMAMLIAAAAVIQLGSAAGAAFAWLWRVE